MGVAPAPALGEQSSVLPGDYGGNLDNKMLGPGATVYFRVNVPGALFSAGDGHAAQGDGEFCVTALEACMVGRFRLTVVKADDYSVARAEEDSAGDDDSSSSDDDSDFSSPPGRVVDASAANGLSSPRATTATHYVTMAFAESLDAAETAALVDMLEWMAELTGADRTSLYRTASLVADMRVTQVVNGRKGVHLTMPKSVAHETRARTRRARRAEGRRGGGEGEENRAKARRDGGGEKEEL
jgi:acetamidase/formamidase